MDYCTINKKAHHVKDVVPLTLGISQDVIEDFLSSLFSSQRGVYFIAGPSGSGTSLTLLSLTNIIKDYESGYDKMLCVERSPNMLIPEVTQSPLPADDASLEMHYAVYGAIVRSDPDLLLMNNANIDRDFEWIMKLIHTGKNVIIATEWDGTPHEMYAEICKRLDAEAASELKQYISGLLHQKILPGRNGNNLHKVSPYFF